MLVFTDLKNRLSHDKLTCNFVLIYEEALSKVTVRVLQLNLENHIN
jgi:hypothetical protein